MEHNKRSYNILELAKKWQEGTITSDEKAYYEEWYADFDDRELELEQGQVASTEELSGRIYSKLKNRIQAEQPYRKTTRLYSSITAAAAIFLILGAGLYFYVVRYNHFGLLNSAGESRYQKINAKNNITPGKNTAILTLANGRKITLSNLKTGIVSNGSDLIYSDGTAINPVIENDAQFRRQSPTDELLNLSTPRGGQYQLTLIDGTRVWLNSASSINYPSTFTGKKERLVELTGEAYFIVKHNARQPFKVRSKGQIVEDIGTEFNINAYTDEAVVKTTLLEGSVKIMNRSGRMQDGDAGLHQDDEKDIVLKPGEQATLTGKSIYVARADTEEAIAWKNGYFKFNENLESIMNKVSRWYNVEVIYQFKPDPTLTFSGKISRIRNIEDVLKIIEFNGDIHFKIEGRRITVMQ